MNENQNETNVPPAAETPPTPVVTTEAVTPTVLPTKTSDLEFSETTIMAALSYIGPLVIIPFLVKRENPFVVFHIKQGLLLLVLFAVLWLLCEFTFWLWPLIKIVQFGLMILALIGIANALQKKEKELPLIGKYGASIKI